MTALRIATRESPLALWQANRVADLLRAAHPGVRAELVPVKTLGDRNRADPLPAMADALSADGAGVGLFTKEVQRAVLLGDADLAVHSLKDLPTGPVPGLALAAVPERASRWDALVLPGGAAGSLGDLPDGATVGTGSPRRRAQLLRVRPDLRFAEARGNVGTRLAKLDAGEFHALVLAEAGLDRLGLAGRVSCRLDETVLPAVGQGALGIECRADDAAARAALAPLGHAATRAEVDAERACLHRLGAGCHAPVGVRAGRGGGRVTLRAALLSADGSACLTADAAGSDPAAVGVEVADALLAAGGADLL